MKSQGGARSQTRERGEHGTAGGSAREAAAPGGELGSGGQETMSMIRRRAARAVVALSGLALALASCQAIENQEAESTEQVLAAAGFHMKEASTPAQLANLEAMAQRKIVIHDQDGQPRYVYADAQDCKCVYVGNEKNYDEYQKLSVKQEIAQENLDASLDWGMWGPWPVY
jgi:hypothetical protein